MFDSDQWSSVELAVRNGGTVCYVVLHVPDRLRRVLYDLEPTDTVLARGELAYCKSPTAAHGQHVIKCLSVQKVAPGAWLCDLDAAPPSGRVAPLPVVESVREQGSRTLTALYTPRAREVCNAGGTQVRNTWWSQRTDWETVCKRARGRANYNSVRRLQAQLRRREVLQLWWQWHDKPGLQTLIAAHLGVHKSTICRDLQRIFPLMTDCERCGQLQPRYWFEADPGGG